MNRLYKILFTLMIMITVGFVNNIYAIDVTTYDEFKNAVSNASNGDEIKITNNITMDETINIVNKNIKIAGKNQEIVLARNNIFLGAFFNIDEDSNVEFTNITLDGIAYDFDADIENAFSVSNGYYSIPIKNDTNDIKADDSLIVSSGQLKITNSVLKNNYNKTKNGGSIRQTKGKITIKNATISHNLSNYGGAVFIDSADEVNIENSTIENNFAYKENNVGCRGGGIYIINSPTININKNEFIKNKVSVDDGGALHINVNNLIENNYNFSNNKYIGNTIGNDGSSIQFTGDNGYDSDKDTIVKFSNELFKGNIGLSPVQSVGTVGHLGLLDTAKVQFEGCTFDGNSQMYGDHGDRCVNEFKNCKFINNYGYFMIFGGSYNIINCNFEKNTNDIIRLASRTSKKAFINIKDSKFKENTGKYHIVVYNYNNNSTSAKNYSLSIVNTVFEDNDVEDSPVDIRMLGSLYIDKCDFENNKVLYSGGGLYVGNTDSVIVKNTQFIGNSSNQGGAISTYQNGESLYENCIIKNNIAENGGGIYTSRGEKDTYKNCIITNNYAKKSAGGISVYIKVADLKKSVIYNNSASKNGGDDVLNNNGTIILPDVQTQNLYLDTGYKIQGWYYDGYRLLDGGGKDLTRWNSKDYVHLYNKKNGDDIQVNEIIAMKAAYGAVAEIDANVILKGKDLKAGDFKYTLTSINDNTLGDEYEAKNTSDGKIKFNISTKENKNGKYIYLLKQINNNEEGMTYSDLKVYVQFTIKDGEIQTEYYQDKACSKKIEKIEFVNEYKKPLKKENNEIKNPSTNDNIKTVIIGLLLSVGILTGLIIIKKKVL